MISVKDADRIIADAVKPYKVVSMALKDAYGAVLGENVLSDRNQPPFDKSLVDGIAIQMSSYEKGGRTYMLKGIQAAGAKPLTLPNADSCIEIMTGSVLPHNCDCVIPIEQVKVSGSQVTVQEGLNLERMQHVQPTASDQKHGDILLKTGSVLLPAQVAIAASVGKSKVKVCYRPTVAVLSTGNELAGITKKKISPYHVRASNSYGVQAALKQNGISKAGIFIVRDNKRLLHKMLEGTLTLFDVIVMSGGVSMGKFDYVPEVLKELGVNVLFHKVNQKPGRPFWFGTNKKGKVVFALPGNPVSTLVCTYRYVLPSLRRATGLPVHQEWAHLADDVKVANDQTNFLPVTLQFEDHGKISASLVKYGGSGDFSALGPSDGFIELEAGKKTFKKGQLVPLFRWK